MAKKRNNQPSFNTPVRIAPYNPAAAPASAPPPADWLAAVAATAAAPAPVNPYENPPAPAPAPAASAPAASVEPRTGAAPAAAPSGPGPQFNVNLDALANMADVARIADPNWSLPNVSAPPLVVGSDPISQAVANNTVPSGFTGRETLTDSVPRPAEGGGGGGGAQSDPYADELRRQANEARRQQRISAIAYLQGLLSQYGLGQLANEVERLVDQYDANPGAIAEGLRQTQPYKDRFKGLIALRNKGVTDVASEADYLRLESEYRQAFRDAGLQSYIGTAGSVTERDAIADLVGKYSVSVNEVKERIADAQRVVADTAPEVRDALQRYYNIAASDLVAYTLDPQRTSTRINQLANAAMFGGLAQRSGLEVGRDAAEQYADLTQGNDLSREAAVNTLTSARTVRDATRRLAEVERSTLSDDETVLAQADLDQQAKRKIRGLQSRERARFGGASAFDRTGLANTTGF